MYKVDGTMILTIMGGNPVVEGWTGRKCPLCNGTGEADENYHCAACAGTGDGFGILDYQPSSWEDIELEDYTSVDSATLLRIVGMDVVKWSNAFVDHMKRYKFDPENDDEFRSTCLSWFANAIMRGYDRGYFNGMKEDEDASKYS